MKNTKVTIVTVTYNAKDLLEETILSVIHQTYDDIEYIIIDGGSNDGTIDIIKRYKDRIDYWISEEDEGIYFAMNKAIEKASGEWINFMNAGDTFFDFDTVKQVMSDKKKDTELIYGDYMNTQQKLCSVAHRQNIFRSMPCCHQSLYTKTNLMKENLFNIRYKIIADYEFILKMYLNGKKLQYIKRPLCVYLEEGFSDREVIQRGLETIALYMFYNIDQNNILQSGALQNLVRNSSLYQEKTTLLEEIKASINTLSSISFIRHPFKKFTQYKNLLKIHYRKNLNHK